jgi:hypothetical protein
MYKELGGGCDDVSLWIRFLLCGESIISVSRWINRLLYGDCGFCVMKQSKDIFSTETKTVESNLRFLQR